MSCGHESRELIYWTSDDGTHGVSCGLCKDYIGGLLAERDEFRAEVERLRGELDAAVTELRIKGRSIDESNAEVERLRAERDAIAESCKARGEACDLFLESSQLANKAADKAEARAQRLEAALREAKEQIGRYWYTEHRPTEWAIVQNAETIIERTLAEESKPSGTG